MEEKQGPAAKGTWNTLNSSSAASCSTTTTSLTESNLDVGSVIPLNVISSIFLATTTPVKPVQQQKSSATMQPTADDDDQPTTSAAAKRKAAAAAPPAVPIRRPNVYDDFLNIINMPILCTDCEGFQQHSIVATRSASDSPPPKKRTKFEPSILQAAAAAAKVSLFCSLCKKEFKHRKNLLAHIRNIHGGYPSRYSIGKKILNNIKR